MLRYDIPSSRERVAPEVLVGPAAGLAPPPLAVRRRSTRWSWCCADFLWARRGRAGSRCRAAMHTSSVDARGGGVGSGKGSREFRVRGVADAHEAVVAVLPARPAPARRLVYPPPPVVAYKVRHARHLPRLGLRQAGQRTMSGGQFDFVCLPACTIHHHGAYAWTRERNQEKCHRPFNVLRVYVPLPRPLAGAAE